MTSKPSISGISLSSNRRSGLVCVISSKTFRGSVIAPETSTSGKPWSRATSRRTASGSSSHTTTFMTRRRGRAGWRLSTTACRLSLCRCEPRSAGRPWRTKSPDPPQDPGPCHRTGAPIPSVIVVQQRRLASSSRNECPRTTTKRRALSWSLWCCSSAAGR